MSLLRKAPNSPDTMASCCSDAKRPRMRAGATSAMYIGANTLAAPMAIPLAIRAMMKNPAEAAAPVPTALARKRTALNSIVGRRPIESASLPAPKAPTAQPSNTEAPAKPVPAALGANAFARASTVPLITPLSKPKRKPPIAATHDSTITYAELAGTPVSPDLFIANCFLQILLDAYSEIDGDLSAKDQSVGNTTCAAG